MRLRLASLGRLTARSAVALSLLAGVGVLPPSQAVAAPDPAVRAAAALTADGEWDDEDYEWYRQRVTEIAEYDSNPEVRAAARAVLANGTQPALRAFIDTGLAQAHAEATQRKAKARKQVQQWAKTSGKVKEWAQRALTDGDYAIAEFVAWGYEIALRLDNPVDDTAAERERIRARVDQLVAQGGPTVLAEGLAALNSGDPAVIAEFYRTGYGEANRTDFENRESVRAALEARNLALEELAAQARTATDAASARAEILAANVEAMQLLDESLGAMRLGTKASRRADQILEEDKPGRKKGQRGRTAEIEALKAEATTQASRAAARARQAAGVQAKVQSAVVKLIRTGQSHGVDWAKVTIAVGVAVDAAASAAETSQHAAEATLADSLALDADANAQEHANNAAKWLAAARRQAETAKNLAEVAKAQQKVAENAAARAKKQRGVAEAAARSAAEHAARARNARVTAQNAAGHAIGQKDLALAAHRDAGVSAAAERKAIARAQGAQEELQSATNRCFSAETEYKEISAALQRARDEATRAGQDADKATAELAGQARRAGDAYEAARGWAARAESAAATARSEAEAATAAANRARAASATADREALTAQRASNKAQEAVRGAVQAAETAMLDARRTEAEARAAVHESAQAVFQAEIADFAAGAAAASAELAVDRAGTAEYIAGRLAEINADARRVMQATAEVTEVSLERRDAAQRRADEAAAAADRATEAAERAAGSVKPAYEAAAQAVRSANEAAAAAIKAHRAAVDAAQDADGARKAASRATQHENSAWGDANLAAGAAASANTAAAMAGNAAAEVERVHKLAVEATAGIHSFKDALIAKLAEIKDPQARQQEVENKQKEYEEAFKKRFMTWYSCQTNHNEAACKKVGDFLVEKGKQALDAGKSYLSNIIKCRNGSEAACRDAWADTVKIHEFYTQVGAGLWEGVKNFGSGIRMLAECGAPYATATVACAQNVQQMMMAMKMLKEHPLELLHLSEWHENPGKALGLTLFDVGTMFIPVPGAGQVAAGVAKFLATMGKLPFKSLARLSKGIATIERLAVKLDDGHGNLPGGLAKLTDVTVEINGRSARILDGVAVIDGVGYRLEGAGLKVVGTGEDLVSGVVRIEGGTVRIDGNLARLDNATVRASKADDDFDAPGTCRVIGGPGFAAGPSLPCDDVSEGSWVYVESGQRLVLAPEVNRAANTVLKLAKVNEPKISPVIREVADGLPDATRQGWAFRLKSANSLKRKLYADLRDPDKTPAGSLAAVSDNIRYTMLFEADRYAAGVRAAMAAMGKKGFEQVLFKNFWTVNKVYYKGINVTWKDPRTGQLFELQFHTPESFWLNKAEHPFYEIIRLPGDDIEIPGLEGLTKEELDEIRKAMWGTVDPPKDVEKLAYKPGVTEVALK